MGPSPHATATGRLIRAFALVRALALALSWGVAFPGAAVAQSPEPPPAAVISIPSAAPPAGVAEVVPIPPRTTPLGPPAPVDKTLRILKQEPPVVTLRALEELARDRVRIVVSLGEQKAWLYNGDTVAIQTPISSGRRSQATPAGQFTVKRKEPAALTEHFGNFIDAKDRVIRQGVDARYDYSPAGSRFQSTPKTHYLEFDTERALGLRGGNLPGYPATRGDIALPPQIAALFFSAAEVGTTIEIRP